MTLGAIGAIVLFNTLLLLTGVAVLWGVRGWQSWGEVGRLLGLSYLTAVACFGVLLVNALVLGIPFGLGLVLGIMGLCAVGGVAAGGALHRPLPPAPRRPGWPGVITLLGLTGIVLYLEGTFRAARLAPLIEWDPMAFWIPKAKAILAFGGLDEQFFSQLPGPSYPPLIPALEASVFRFIGHPDQITIHVQFWFLFVGFLAAMAGLIAPRVRPVFFWPVLLLIALAPEMLTNVLLAQADKLLDYFVALAVVLIVLWLFERERWQIILAALFLSGAMLTKREGFLLVACVIAAALVASWARKRKAWPPLLIAGGVAFALTRPWHHWFDSREIATGIGQEGPALGYLGFLRHPDRIWPSLRLTLDTLFTSDVWLLITPLLVLAIVAAALVGVRLLPTYAGSFLLFGILACSWVTATTESGTLRPIVRLTGGLVLAMAGLLPLLLHATWERTGAGQTLGRIAASLPAPRKAALGLAVAAALVYPVAVLAGGSPPFPSHADCAKPARSDGEIHLVLGTFGSFNEAAPFVEKVKTMGFIQAEPRGNGCGLVEVAVPGYTSLEGAEDAAGEARRSGLTPLLQQG